MKTINIANDYTKFPAGRYVEDGPFSGERFRKEILLPALEEGEKVIVELDGAMGYGSSFLDEAFGGLVREEKMSPDQLCNIIVLKTIDKSLKAEIQDYIQHAEINE